MIKNKTVLITGAAGFIGSSMCERWNKDNKIYIVDNYLTGRKSNLKDMENVTILESLNPEEGVPKEKIDVIIYLGGRSSLPLFDGVEEIREDLNYYCRWLAYAEDNGIDFLFASTSSFYAEYPSTETSRTIIRTYYEALKSCMESIARSSSKEAGTRTIGLRFFSVYGKRERHKQHLANLASQMLWSAERGGVFEVYGDGEQTRDFTYIDDLVDAVELLYKKGESGEVYNIGYGVEYTINEVAQLIKDVTGLSVEMKYIPNPLKNYVKKTASDTEKIRKLGWKPKYDLVAGLKAIWTERESK